DENSLLDWLKLAYLWKGSIVFSSLNEPRAARRFLSNAHSEASKTDFPSGRPYSELGTPQYDYPQYFERDRKEAIFHYLEGLISLKEGDATKAGDEFKEALKYDSDMWEAYYNLGNAFFVNGRTEEARNIWKKLVKKVSLDIIYRPENVYFN